MLRRGAVAIVLALLLGGCATSWRDCAEATGPHCTYTYRDLQSVRSISAP
jgi:hypothetical protein